MLITLEGVEGSGKSTQVLRLAERLRKAKLPVVVTKEPGGTLLGQELRALLLTHHRSGEEWCPTSELLLFYADRAQHLAALVLPALQAGKIVLIDRFEDSSWAYQGAKGISDENLGCLREIVMPGFKPDLTVVLDMDPEESLRRVGARNARLGDTFKETRFDQEALDYHQKVRDRFLDIARKESGRVVLVPAQAGLDEVEDDVWRVVRGFLETRGFKVT